MKALMGALAKQIRKDSQGREALRVFITESDKDDKIITLSNGKRYKVSRNKPEVEKAMA